MARKARVEFEGAVYQEERKKEERGRFKEERKKGRKGSLLEFRSFLNAMKDDRTKLAFSQTLPAAAGGTDLRSYGRVATREKGRKVGRKGSLLGERGLGERGRFLKLALGRAETICRVLERGQPHPRLHERSGDCAGNPIAGGYSPSLCQPPSAKLRRAPQNNRSGAKCARN